MAYTAIPAIGEFGLIENIASIVAPTLAAVPELLTGIGDDCAVFEPAPELLQVATTDLLVEHVHFDLLTTPLKHLGKKAISVNVSDICAMNALPCYALIGLAVPPNFPISMIEEIYRGMSQAAEEYGLAIAGGDTSSSHSGLMISVTMIGEVSPEMITRRNGAGTGDLICVTGTIGGATAGLKLLMREKAIMLEHLKHNESCSSNILADLQEYSEAIKQQLLPHARIDMVKYFHSKNITPSAMIDISDGLSSDLQHLCRRSSTGAIIYEERLPIHASTRQIADEFQDDALTWALTGGEDYQLLFTIAKEAYENIAENTAISVIGEITDAENGINLRDQYGMNIAMESIRGFDHFSA